MKEHFFTCPYCWDHISMLIDNTLAFQEYIEDCEVCCNPINIRLNFSNMELSEFQATSIEQ